MAVTYVANNAAV